MARKQKYSVLLQYEGGDTYFSWVRAETEFEAAHRAVVKCCEDNGVDIDPKYAEVLAVFAGYLEILLRKEDI